MIFNMCVPVVSESFRGEKRESPRVLLRLSCSGQSHQSSVRALQIQLLQRELLSRPRALCLCACAHACPCMFLCLCLLFNQICTGVVTGDVTKYLCRPHEALLNHTTGAFFHVAAFVSTNFLHFTQCSSGTLWKTCMLPLFSCFSLNKVPSKS